MKRGRPKGYSPYIEIRYEDLADWVGRKTKVPVSKKWLQELIDEDSNLPLDNSTKEDYNSEIESKIEYTLTQFDDE